MKSTTIIFGNQKTPQMICGVYGTVEFCFERQDTDKRIISFLIVSLQAITKTLSIRKIAAICLAAVDWWKCKPSVLYGLSSPTEPNSTKRRVVINYVINSTFWHGAYSNGLFCACYKILKNFNKVNNMSNSLFNPNKHGFKHLVSNSAFMKKHGKKQFVEAKTNPCDREKLIAGLKEAQGK